MEIKGGAGDFDDMADGMQCSDHPYRSNLGGICALCLQEKLGKLVSSSSFPFPVAVGSSSPSSPRSFRSDVASSNTTVANRTALYSLKSSKLDHERNKSRMISFLLAKKSKNKKPSSSEASLKRSKSTAAARHGTRAALEQFESRNHRYFMENDDGGNNSSRRRGSFWSFLSSKSATRKGGDRKSSIATENTLPAFPEDDDEVSPANSQSTSAVSVSLPGAFDRKVSRSRSVGCGSRSFSGDFFERISTGLGDCALRRVESQREGRPKNHHLPQPSSSIAAAHHHSCMKERVKCAGIIFGGFSSSSSSSSSSYWVPSSGEDKPAHLLRHQKSWNWAFASPMRAFTRPPSTKYSKRELMSESSNKNSAPNLAAIPSLLAVVRG